MVASISATLEGKLHGLNFIQVFLLRKYKYAKGTTRLPRIEDSHLHCGAAGDLL